jgi:hypothetical protein
MTVPDAIGSTLDILVFKQFFAIDTLPQFDAPEYAELCECWKKYRDRTSTA